jgi:hypothetical protein
MRYSNVLNYSKFSTACRLLVMAICLSTRYIFQLLTRNCMDHLGKWLNLRLRQHPSAAYLGGNPRGNSMSVKQYLGDANVMNSLSCY